MHLPIRGMALAVAAIVLTGCTGDDPPPPAPEPAPEAEPTTLATYDAAEVRVVRGPFCDRVSPTGIEHALDDSAESSDSWEDGDRVRLPDGSRDLVHEFGCAWTAADGTRAAAWVFVPPVTKQRARGLAKEAGGPGCGTTRDVGLGSVSVATRCSEDGVTEETYRGLIGDAWLTCTLATPDEPVDLPERTSAWCVSVLQAARA